MTKSCEHKYVFLRSEKIRKDYRFVSYFSRTDVFFCEKCLTEARKTNEVQTEEIPGWFNAP